MANRVVVTRQPPSALPRLEADLWAAYAKRFVTDEGRVIDRENGNASHTEGQGYGMLLAEAAGDRARFDAAQRAWPRTLSFTCLSRVHHGSAHVKLLARFTLPLPT